MKTQITPTFPRNVVGRGGISVNTANGTTTITQAPPEPVIINGDNVILAGTSVVAVVRDNPAVTNLQLPDVALQAGVPLRIVDWSTNVVNHQIALVPIGAQTIKRLAAFNIYSNAAELGAATLYPSVSLNGWYLAP